MSPKQIELARHALGLDNPDARGCSYRNRYFVSENTEAAREFKRMVLDGNALAFVGKPPGYEMTLKGAQAALRDGERLDPEDFPALRSDKP